MVVHMCNSSIWEAGSIRSEFEASLGYRVRPVGKEGGRKEREDGRKGRRKEGKEKEREREREKMKGERGEGRKEGRKKGRKERRGRNNSNQENHQMFPNQAVYQNLPIVKMPVPEPYYRSLESKSTSLSVNRENNIYKSAGFQITS
jgi:hypothetical protein